MRAIAVCTNGPFNNKAFSVEPNPDGSIPNLESRFDLYDEDKPYECIGKLTASEEQLSYWHNEFDWAEHADVYEYRISE